MAAILKFFKRHLPNGKSDWAETWWEVSGRLNIQNCSIRSVSISRMAAILNFLYDISRTESQFVLVLDGGYRGDTNIQNCSIRSVSISKMATILKFFKRHLTQDRKVRLSWNLLGGIGTTWRFSIAKIVSFRYPRWPMAAIFKLFKRHILSNGNSDWADTWWEISGRHGDSELLKSIRSHCHLELL